MIRFLAVVALTAATVSGVAATPAQASTCVTAACVNAAQPIYYDGVENLTGTNQVWRVGNDGSGLTRVTSLTDHLVSFSHDRGHTLVVLHRDANQDVVSSMNTDGTGTTTLATAAALSLESVSISPDGRSVAVWVHNTIALVTPSGLRTVGSVTPGTVGARDLVWSPDGRRIGFDITDVTGSPTTVHALDVATGAVSASLGVGYVPTWSPDAQQLAYVRVGGGIAVRSGSGTRTLPIAARTVSWSPDGAWFAYCDAPHREIRKVRTDGTGETLLARVVASSSLCKVDWGYPLPVPGSTLP